MKALFTMLTLASLMMAGSSTHAAITLSGTEYSIGNFTAIGSPTQAAGVVNTTTPTATFTSTLINSGATYSGQDGGSFSQSVGNSVFLSAIPADAATASANPSPLGSFVIDLTGTFSVGTSGNYAFTTGADDGASFYLNGNGTSGTGVALGYDSGDHGEVIVTSVYNLLAGHNYSLEYIYYNQGCAGCGFTGNADNSGGGAVAFGSITQTSATPEPASVFVWGLAAGAGLIVARRRRRAA